MAEPVKLVARPTTTQEVRDHPDGTWSDHASDTEIFTEAIGRLEVLKAKWIRAYLDHGSGT